MINMGISDGFLGVLNAAPGFVPNHLRAWQAQHLLLTIQEWECRTIDLHSEISLWHFLVPNGPPAEREWINQRSMVLIAHLLIVANSMDVIKYGMNSDGKEDFGIIYENRENVVKVKRLLQQCGSGVKDNYFSF